jgi:hypothetical protein
MVDVRPQARADDGPLDIEELAFEVNGAPVLPGGCIVFVGLRV